MSPEVAAWFGAWWPIWAPLLAIALTASGGGIWAIIVRRDSDRVARKNPLPPTWPEMWARIDEQDKRIEAQDSEIGELKQQIRTLGAEKKAEKLRVERGERERDLMMQHILALEFLVPNPPGPPARPSWSLST